MPSHLPDPAVARRALTHWETVKAEKGVTGGLRHIPAAFLNGYHLIRRLQAANVDTADFVWLVPAGMCNGVLTIFGVPVQQVEGLAHPMVAHPFEISESEAAAISAIDLR